MIGRYLFSIWLVLTIPVSEGLPIKQLITNLTTYLLAAFLQLKNIDLCYGLNIRSSIFGQISFSVLLVIFWRYLSKTNIGPGKLAIMKDCDRKLLIARLGASYMNFKLNRSFFRLFLLWNTIRKILATAAIVFAYQWPWVCIAYLIAQQAAWSGVFAFYQFRRVMKFHLVVLFGEIQLFANILMIGWIYLINVYELEEKDEKYMDQASLHKRYQLGWIVIGIFLSQNLIMFADFCLTTIPSAISTLRLIFGKYLAEIYLHTIYIWVTIPVWLRLMDYFPSLFRLTSYDQRFRPIRKRIQEISQIMYLNRRIYHAHTVYKLPLESIVSLPE